MRAKVELGKVMMQANPYARIVSDMFMVLEFCCPFQPMGIEGQMRFLKLSNKVVGNWLLGVCPKSGKHVTGN